MKRSKSRLLVAALAISAALATSTGRAIAEEEEGYWSQAGLGVGSFFREIRIRGSAATALRVLSTASRGPPGRTRQLTVARAV